MKLPGSPTTASVSSSSRWPRRAIPVPAATRSVCITSTAGSSNTTRQSVAPRYKQSSAPTVPYTRCRILDPCARTSGRLRIGCYAMPMIPIPSRACPRLPNTWPESSRSTISVATGTVRRRGARPCATSAIEPGNRARVGVRYPKDALHGDDTRTETVAKGRASGVAPGTNERTARHHHRNDLASA